MDSILFEIRSVFNSYLLPILISKEFRAAGEYTLVALGIIAFFFLTGMIILDTFKLAKTLYTLKFQLISVAFMTLALVLDGAAIHTYFYPKPTSTPTPNSTPEPNHAFHDDSVPYPHIQYYYDPLSGSFRADTVQNNIKVQSETVIPNTAEVEPDWFRLWKRITQETDNKL